MEIFTVLTNVRYVIYVAEGAYISALLEDLWTQKLNKKLVPHIIEKEAFNHIFRQFIKTVLLRARYPHGFSLLD